MDFMVALRRVFKLLRTHIPRYNHIFIVSLSFISDILQLRRRSDQLADDGDDTDFMAIEDSRDESDNASEDEVEGKEGSEQDCVEGSDVEEAYDTEEDE